jgi:hypothetical protein
MYLVGKNKKLNLTTVGLIGSGTLEYLLLSACGVWGEVVNHQDLLVLECLRETVNTSKPQLGFLSIQNN